MKTIPYLAAMGSMMYLETTTCPDIAYVAGALARFGSDPGVAHCNAVKHLLCYLQGTASYTLTYNLDNTTSELFTHSQMLTMVDAKIVAIHQRVHHQDGHWSCKLVIQATNIVALSSTEAEYSAAIEAWKGDCWMRNILSKLGFKSDKPSTLQMTNQINHSSAKNLEHLWFV